VVLPVALSDDKRAVGFEADFPAAFVHQVVVSAAQRNEVVQVGGAAVFPWPDVMYLAMLKLAVAAAEGAGGVHGAQGPALGTVGDTDLAPGVEYDAVDADGVRHDGGFAADATDRVGG